MKKILGISAFYHDSAAAIVIGGHIVAAAQEERFTRDKHTPDFPVEAIKYCLEESGLEINELDAVVFYDKPLLKFERLLETYYSFAPKGLISFLKAIPIWINEKIFLKKLIFDGLKEIGNYDKKKIKLLFPEHHLSHAASTFYTSKLQKSAILTIDGVGEWCTASIGLGIGNKIEIIKELNFPHSVGLLYSAFTYFLGFKVNSGEYKLMGLAPYGNPTSEKTLSYIKLIKEKLVKIHDDGSVWLDQSYYNYSTGLKMIKENKWEKIFNLKTRKPEEEITQEHCNIAIAIQKVTEEIVIKMAKEAIKITGSKNLCMAGGVALNCVANGKLLKEGFIDNLYIQPAAGDAGGALGAALATNYIYFDSERTIEQNIDPMKGTYLGPSFSEKEILSMTKKVKGVYCRYDSYEDLNKIIAQKIANGDVVGWFQDRMEFGPRALGCRSIIGDARNPEMQKKLNLKIKYREGFRPFAPSVLSEFSEDYFDLKEKSPYMLLVAPVKHERRKQLPDNFHNKNLLEKLYMVRSDIQSVTHLDFSARIQTVHRETNPKYWALINEFKKQTGFGLVVNTSFNVRGEPIVCKPYDAYRCFMSTEMDYLVINNFVYSKKDQMDSENREKWRVKFKID
jgi:carbamoyltransferase